MFKLDPYIPISVTEDDLKKTEKQDFLGLFPEKTCFIQDNLLYCNCEGGCYVIGAITEYMERTFIEVVSDFFSDDSKEIQIIKDVLSKPAINREAIEKELQEIFDEGIEEDLESKPEPLIILSTKI